MNWVLVGLLHVAAFTCALVGGVTLALNEPIAFPAIGLGVIFTIATLTRSMRVQEENEHMLFALVNTSDYEDRAATLPSPPPNGPNDSNRDTPVMPSRSWPPNAA